MHARSALVKVAADRFDEVVRALESDLGPRYHDAAGFCGFTVVADRGSGQVFGISFWKTEEDRDNADELGRSVRDDTAEIAMDDRKEPTMQLWEVVHFDMAGTAHI